MREPLPRMVRVNGSRKCPACKKGDWCLISPDGKSCICTRVESRKRCGEAGWLHRLEEPLPAFEPPQVQKRVYVDWAGDAAIYARNVPKGQIARLEANLGLPAGGLA